MGDQTVLISSWKPIPGGDEMLDRTEVQRSQVDADQRGFSHKVWQESIEWPPSRELGIAIGDDEEDGLIFEATCKESQEIQTCLIGSVHVFENDEQRVLIRGHGEELSGYYPQLVWSSQAGLGSHID
jgi:hypothetical protein